MEDYWTALVKRSGLNTWIRCNAFGILLKCPVMGSHGSGNGLCKLMSYLINYLSYPDQIYSVLCLC